MFAGATPDAGGIVAANLAIGSATADRDVFYDFYTGSTRYWRVAKNSGNNFVIR